MQYDAMVSNDELCWVVQFWTILSNAWQCYSMLGNAQKSQKCSNLQTKLSNMFSYAQLGSALLKKGKQRMTKKTGS